MDTPQATPRPLQPTPGPLPPPPPAPARRAQSHELRELLEAHLRATQALLEEQQRTLSALDAMRADLEAKLRALAEARAPWVQAMTETRALLYVALREVIVGDDEAGVSMHLPAQPAAGAAPASVGPD